MAEKQKPKRSIRFAAQLFVGAAVLTGIGSDTRSPDTIERHVSDVALDPHDIEVMTANVLGFESYEKTSTSNVSAITKAIEDTNPDVVCFQEFNPDREPGFIDKLSKLGYNVIFASTVRQGYQGLREGNAIASKGDIKSYHTQTLPNSNSAIPRQVLYTDIRTASGYIRVANTHLGLDSTERRLQGSYIDRMNLGQTLNCGDYNQRFPTSGRVGLRSQTSKQLLSPYKPESTSITGEPTHSSGIIDRISTDCGRVVRQSIEMIPINSDHQAVSAVFDLSNCLVRTP